MGGLWTGRIGHTLNDMNYSYFSKTNVLLYSFLFLVGLNFFISREVQNNTYHPSFAQNITPAIQFEEIEKALVEDFPSIPLYPGAAIDESYEKIVKGEQGYEAEWYTKDSIRQVLEYYEKALPEDGWVLDFIPENFDAYEAQYEAHKGDQKLFLMIEVAETKENMTEIIAEFPLQ